MASIFKRGRKWYVRFRFEGREIWESAGPERRNAERLLSKRLTEIAEGRFLQKRHTCALTLDDFVPEYLAWARQHKRSADRDERSLKFLTRYLGNVRLDRFTVGHVERYRRARLSGELRCPSGRPAGPATVNRELACLRKLLNLAVDFGHLMENPLAGKITMAKESAGRLRYLEPEEIQRLLAECSPRIRDVVRLLLLTGCRKSEILLLTWPEVDLRRGLIRLPGERTKNGNPRAVPLSAEAKRILERARRNKVKGCPYVFHDNGKQIKSIRTGFERACRRAGIEDFRLHDLRHCTATAMASRGVSLQTIAEVLGHKTFSMVQRYAHLSPQVLQAAVGQVEAFAKGAGAGAGFVLIEGKKRHVVAAPTGSRNGSSEDRTPGVAEEL